MNQPKILAKIDPSTILTSLDYAFLLSSIFITVILVIYSHYSIKKESKSKVSAIIEYLVMGRRLTLPMFTATLVATWYGGIFGVTEIAFNQGIFNFITQGFFWYITYIIFALFMVDRIGKYQAVTLPDLIHKMFGPISSKISIFFNFFNVLPMAYTISLGLFIQLLFGGNLYLNAFYGLIFVNLYGSFGGLRAVVFSDILQFFIMCLSVFLVLVFSMTLIGPPSLLVEGLPKHYFSLTGNEGWSTTIVWGLIALSTLVDPNFYQRCFAAKDTKTAKKGILLSTAIWLVFDICTTFGAMYAKFMIPDADSSTAYMIYSLQILPDGLRGLFLGGILATILSTIDSYLFIAGTTLTYDLLKIKSKSKLIWHHLGFALVSLFSLGMSIIFEGNIKKIWKTFGSYSAACLLIPVVFGHLFKNKISDHRFAFSCLFGVFGTTFYRLAPKSGVFVNIDDLYVGASCSLLGLILFPLISSKKSSV